MAHLSFLSTVTARPQSGSEKSKEDKGKGDEEGKKKKNNLTEPESEAKVRMERHSDGSEIFCSGVRMFVDFAWHGMSFLKNCRCL